MIYVKIMEYSLNCEFYVIYDVITDDKNRYRVKVPADEVKSGNEAEYIRRKVNAMRRNE